MGSLIQSGGTNGSNSLYLGDNSGSSGAYGLSGNSRLSASSEYLGYSGTGTFTQLSATNSASYLYLGANSGSSGAYSLGGGGQLSASVEYVGSSGTGTFTQLSATNSASYLYLGELRQQRRLQPRRQRPVVRVGRVRRLLGHGELDSVGRGQ